MKYNLDIDKVETIGMYVWEKEKDRILGSCGFANFEFGGRDVLINNDMTNIEELSPTPLGTIAFEDWDEEILPILKNDFFFICKNFSLRPKEHKRYHPIDTIIHINRQWLIPIEE